MACYLIKYRYEGESKEVVVPGDNAFNALEMFGDLTGVLLSAVTSVAPSGADVNFPPLTSMDCCGRINSARDVPSQPHYVIMEFYPEHVSYVVYPTQEMWMGEIKRREAEPAGLSCGTWKAIIVKPVNATFKTVSKGAEG